MATYERVNAGLEADKSIDSSLSGTTAVTAIVRWGGCGMERDRRVGGPGPLPLGCRSGYPGLLRPCGRAGAGQIVVKCGDESGRIATDDSSSELRPEWCQGAARCKGPV